MDLADFLDHELFPTLWDRLPAAFPEFGWVRRGRYYVATQEAATRSLPGAPRPDRVWAYEDSPFGLKIHGGEFVTWLAYVARGHALRGSDFVEAVRQLCERAGLPMPETPRSPQELQQVAAAARRAELLEAFLAQAMAALVADPQGPAGQYLQARGLPPESWGPAELGVCPPCEQTQAALGARGYGLEEIREAGLLPPAFDQGQALINQWPGRLVGGWRGRGGRLENLWARDLSGEAAPERKYLMLRGGSKAVPYGLHGAQSRDLVVVEGFLDCLQARLALGSPQGAPDPHPVAIGGGLLSAEQVAALEAFRPQSVTLNLDYDGPGGAGTEATLQTAQRLAGVGFRAYVVDPVYMADNGNVEAKVDPDSFIRRHGPDAYRALLDSAVPAAVYTADALLDRYDLTTHRGRDAALAALLPYHAGLRDERDRQAVWERAAPRLQYAPETLAALSARFAQQQQTAALQRDLLRSLERTLREVREGRQSPQAAVAALAGELQGLQGRALGEEADVFGVAELLERLARAPAGLPSGWEPLDRLEVRFHPGELAVIGGRTGHGKTTALLGLALNWRQYAPTGRVLLYSFELPPEAVLLKLLTMLVAQQGPGYSYYQLRELLRRPRGPEGYPAAVEAGLAALAEVTAGLTVCYRPAWNAGELAAHALRLGTQGPVKAVLVDYLQLVSPPPGSYDRRDIEVSQVARRLKALAVELECPVVAAAQIGRQAIPAGQAIPGGAFGERAVREAIRRRRPQLHHLREGGSEQEADLVLGLLCYRADYLEEREEVSAEERSAPGPLEVLVLKNRFGELGTARLVLEGRTGVMREPVVGEEW